MSDIPDNINRFNLTTLSLFKKLYNEFPTPIELCPLSVGFEAAPANVNEESDFLFGTGAGDVITWLAEEGFLRFGKRTLSGEFYEVRLSQKGLTVLGSLPTSLTSNDEKETVITRIKRTLAAGTEKAGTEAAKNLISEIFKLSLKYGLSGGTVPGVSA